MKKYTLFLFVSIFSFVLFGLSVNYANAQAVDSGCTSAGPYSTTTGRFCGATTTEVSCTTGHVFSPATGMRCTVWQDSSFSQDKVAALLDTLFKRELAVGSKGEDVRALQQILKDAGFLSGNVDGSYGPVTMGAVMKFQAESSIASTGKVDASTIGKIKVRPWYEICPLANAQGVNYACPPRPIPVPPICPLVNANGITRYICPPLPTQSLVIRGVSGPQSLNVNQQGTWTVTAHDLNGGNLSYSVNWGDEFNVSSPAREQFMATNTGQSATFTHSYSQAGIYNPTFTVTSENTIRCITTPCPTNGGTAQTSLTVNVVGTRQEITIPTISSLSPASGMVGTSVTITGRGFTSTNNSVKFGGGYINGLNSNGTKIIFTIPEGMSPCPPGAEVCIMSYMQVTPGSYPVSVINSNGTSNNLNFEVIADQD